MPVTKDKSAPYAPPRSILSILDRNRSRGLPTPITSEVLTQTGISDSLNSRTLQALQALDLIDEEGKHAEALKALRLAPEDQYKERMAEWLNAAYQNIVAIVDPATDDDTKVRDAFRPYNPTGQQDRMVTLFTGLYEAAGVRPEKMVGSVKRERPSRPATSKQKQKKSVRFEPKPGAANWSGHAPTVSIGGLPAALSGLLSSLPREGNGWSQERRNKFLTTFAAVLDFCFPIRKDEPSVEDLIDELDAEDENDNGDAE